MRGQSLLTLLMLLPGCRDAVAPVGPFSGMSLALARGDTVHVDVRDSRGRRVDPGAFMWTSEDPNVVAVDTDGLVLAIAGGSTRVDGKGRLGSVSAGVSVTRPQEGWLSTGGWCGIWMDGSVYCSSLPWAREEATVSRVGSGLTFDTVVAGAEHGCALTPAGEAYCWGQNEFGQLGDGSFTPSTQPMRVAGALRFLSLSAGDVNTCGVVAGADVYCWGSDYAGQLGQDSTPAFRCGYYNSPCSPIPLKVRGDHDFVAVYAGAVGASGFRGVASPGIGWTCGLDPRGQVFCWGDNEGGTLGDGTRQASSVPVRAQLPEAATGIALGMAHVCAVGQSGRLYCWGWNYQDALGAPGAICSSSDVASYCSPTPIPVQEDLRFHAVAAGWMHTCALDRRGSAWCWGDNTARELGPGAVQGSRYRVQVSGTPPLIAMEALLTATCAVAAHGSVYCWGADASLHEARPIGTPGMPTR